MRYWINVFFIALSLVLGGCASTIQSEVTAFHEWPGNLQDKSYVFELQKEQENNLEYRSYQNLVRTELQRLGFAESTNTHSARLKVSMQYQVEGRDVRVVQPVAIDPWYGPGFYGPYWPYYGPYHPFWYGPPIIEQRESRYQLFTRQLKIGISRVSDNRKIYDVTVNSRGTNSSLAAVMPYMVRSAFADFPGQSGVSRIVELKMDKQE